MGNKHSSSAQSTRDPSPVRGGDDGPLDASSPRTAARRRRLTKSESADHTLQQPTSPNSTTVPEAQSSSSQPFTGEPVSPQTLAQHFSQLFGSSPRQRNSPSSSSQNNGPATNLEQLVSRTGRPEQNAPPDISNFLNSIFGPSQTPNRSSSSRARIFERNGALFAYVNGRVIQLQAPRTCQYCNKQINPFQEEYDLHVVKCMTKPRIKSLTFVVSETDTELLDPDRECMICFEEYKVGQTCARLECFCVFHKACLDNWLSRKQCCPLHMKDED